MKRASVVFVAAIALAALVGCGDIYKVRVLSAKNPKGIPFYINAGACVQETTYATPYYLVTLKVSDKSGVLISESTKLGTAGHSSYEFKQLMLALETPEPDFDTVRMGWNALKQNQPFNPYTQNDGQFLLKNASKVSTVVDYEHAYTLNESKPLAGTVSADYKLNSDGTLAEAQGQVQEQTLATILGVLPLSDLIKSAAGISTKAGKAAAGGGEPVHITLEQEERIVTETFSLATEYRANCPTGVAITSSTPGASVALADLGAKDASGKGASDKADSSIGIAGTITLPKGMVQPVPKDVAAGKTAGATKPGSPGSADSAGGKDTNQNKKQN